MSNKKEKGYISDSYFGYGSNNRLGLHIEFKCQSLEYHRFYEEGIAFIQKIKLILKAGSANRIDKLIDMPVEVFIDKEDDYVDGWEFI